MDFFDSLHLLKLGVKCGTTFLKNPPPLFNFIPPHPQERMTNRLGKIQSSSEQYLLQHRFGDQLEDEEVEDEELVKAFEEYKEKLQGPIV